MLNSLSECEVVWRVWLVSFTTYIESWCDCKLHDCGNGELNSVECLEAHLMYLNLKWAWNEDSRFMLSLTVDVHCWVNCKLGKTSIHNEITKRDSTQLLTWRTCVSVWSHHFARIVNTLRSDGMDNESRMPVCINSPCIRASVSITPQEWNLIFASSGTITPLVSNIPSRDARSDILFWE